MKPDEIEKRSFALITEELGNTDMPPDRAAVVKRVIHTTADFDYARTLVFANDALAAGLDAFGGGTAIITDTAMALAGINKSALARHGCAAHCHIADPDVAEIAQANGWTRSRTAMDKAVRLHGDAVYVIGNAPTALMRLCKHIENGTVRPRLIIGVPVGFVNVVESKEQALALPAPSIIARGRKGGSNVAAAICNALLYLLDDRGDRHAESGD